MGWQAGGIGCYGRKVLKVDGSSLCPDRSEAGIAVKGPTPALRHPPPSATRASQGAVDVEAHGVRLAQRRQHLGAGLPLDARCRAGRAAAGTEGVKAPPPAAAAAAAAAGAARRLTGFPTHLRTLRAQQPWPPSGAGWGWRLPRRSCEARLCTAAAGRPVACAWRAAARRLHPLAALQTAASTAAPPPSQSECGGAPREVVYCFNFCPRGKLASSSLGGRGSALLPIPHLPGVSAGRAPIHSSARRGPRARSTCRASASSPTTRRCPPSSCSSGGGLGRTPAASTPSPASSRASSKT